MDQPRRDQLDNIIALSRRMLEQARGNEWEEVASLEAKRRELVMQCFGQATSQDDVPELASAIKEVLGLNDAVAELGKQRRGALGGDIRINKVGRMAKSAYLGCNR